jgi:hypothetical protein
MIEVPKFIPQRARLAGTSSGCGAAILRASGRQDQDREHIRLRRARHGSQSAIIL